MQMNMLPVEDAQDRVLAAVGELGVEEVALLDSLGRTVARDLASDIDVAPFANSAMDGFAVRSSDIEGATKEAPVDLEVIAHIGAGSVYDGPVGQGQAVRIMTGAPVPAACDAVVKIEDVIVVSGRGSVGAKVAFSAPAKPQQNIREAGQEARAGQIVFSRGEVVDSAGIGLLASCGHATVPVYRRPRVGVLGIGSELVGITDVPGPGMIRNSNSHSLAAQAKEAGAVATIYPTVPDDRGALLETLSKAVSENDLVCSSGGASAGDFDYVTSVVGELGRVIFDRVNMRPGKSQTLGIVNGVPVLGLAGNPAAAFVGFEMLIRPALLKMQGRQTAGRPITLAKLKNRIDKREKRREYLRGRVDRAEDGSWEAESFKNQSSSLIGTMHRSNCLLVIPEGEQHLAAGDEVACMRLDMLEGAQ